MSRKHHVRNAQDYAECARAVTQSINILYVDSAVIESRKAELDQMWDRVISVKGTQGMHCIRTVEYGVVSASPYSEKEGEVYYLLPESVPQNPPTDSTTDTPTGSSTASDQDSAEITIIPGHWYAVNWEPTSYWFIGRAIEQTEGDMWVFSFIHQTDPTANRFRLVDDVEPVSVKNIFVEVQSPAPTSSSRTELLKLTTTDFKTVLKKFQEL